MQTTMGAPAGSAGHSANLAKLKRNAAFTATSGATSTPVPAAIPGAAMSVAARAMLATPGHPCETPRGRHRKRPSQPQAGAARDLRHEQQGAGAANSACAASKRFWPIAMADRRLVNRHSALTSARV